ncbi:hypothetical protein ACFQER_15805 [Halomicroarcula sp. GCM10025894]|uniref:hypothetical protein n=1 Tax=Halomicroarcula sp. GCM10025894 TaxID=3252673 RepID=UPI003614A214
MFDDPSGAVVVADPPSAVLLDTPPIAVLVGDPVGVVLLGATAAFAVGAPRVLVVGRSGR